MPCRYGHTTVERIPVELVEADFEIGFHLVDLSEDRPLEAVRVLADAEEVYADILTRVEHLSSPDAVSFLPLLTELRRAIDLAHSHL